MKLCVRRSLSLVFTILILAPAWASAQTVVNLGQDYSGTFLRSYFNNGLEGTPLDGRTITRDFVFADDKSLEIVPGGDDGNSFFLNLALKGTNEITAIGGEQFSGWVEDRFGNRIEGVTNGRGGAIGLFGYQLAFTTEEAAVEISRIQYTVILPTVEGATLISNSFFDFSPGEGGELIVRAQTVSGEARSFGAVKAQHAH